MRGVISRGRRQWMQQAAAMTVLPVLPFRQAQAAGAPRIVSVGGALTEIVYAIGAQSLLAGVDTTSLFPEAVRSLPNVGYARTLSAEGVLSLAPTVLIATEDAGPPAVLRQIEQAGVNVMILPAKHRYEGVVERIQRVGELCGRREQAAACSQAVQRAWQQTQQQVATKNLSQRKVMFILSHSPSQVMVSGRGTAADAMLQYVGARNAASATSGFDGYKPLTAEAVIAAQPDVLLLSDQGMAALGGVDGVLKLPGVAQTEAGRMRRIVSQEAMFLLGFGPRLPASVAALHGALVKVLG